ncbi:conserved hypothetical protein (plasmid) [Rhodococcus jostii RHA1]|uniref:Antitoxin Xre/MbcA/ParS-like toxin-binding domain-containing protein n=1 Tax=Rhodococcus jostii (strain RHA1) TaxID=101510 RepID=Q0RX36_RHOJR|nr:hypothetical protein [Rhodococcus jostii]ABH00150.1 conserved hypothetical protein [Rhodococcus jostii RHA1]
MSAEAFSSGPAPAIDPVVVARMSESIRVEGLERALGTYFAEFRLALVQAGKAPDSGPRAGRRGTELIALGAEEAGGDVVTALTQFSAAALSQTERLQLAQSLIATVTDTHDTGPRATARRSVLDALEVIDSKEVATILAPTSEPIRSVAQKRRKAGELIGLPIGSRPDYRYPLFQFDRARHQIHDLVKYANRRLAVADDPYGAASWWLTATELLDGRSPLEDLEAGELTEIAIDNVLDVARRGM